MLLAHEPPLEVTVIVLCELTDGRLARMQTFTSDQDAVDEYWSTLDLSG